MFSRSTGHLGRSTPALTRSLFNSRYEHPIRQRLRNGFYTLVTVSGLGLGLYYYSDSRAGIHTYIAMPIMRNFTDPETAHNLAVKALALGLTPKDPVPDDESLAFTLWGRQFSNPIGLAAGLDKQAEGIDGLFDLGFGYVEIGSVTPLPQPGNEKPRYFRLPDDRAAINRYGFNSDGHRVVGLRLRSRIQHALFQSAPSTDALATQLAKAADISSVLDATGLPKSLRQGKVLAVNLGKNKNGDEVEDYVAGVRNLGKYADVLVVNVSSPNTPGLRQLQHGDALKRLLKAVVEARDQHVPRTPVCVKIAPDLDEEEITSIAKSITEARVDGCIISNTTISRPQSLTPHENISQTGGLSGPPVKPLTMKALRAMRKATDGKVVLVACGGVSTGRDVLEYGLAGASFVQAYTGFGYDGVRFPRRIKDELLTELRGRKWEDIVGKGSSA
ncbi:Dihydroorotate dehydrogenase (quinone), mitochondrial [Savitreella phatthalungensis]